jgi:hypothetical protein
MNNILRKMNVVVDRIKGVTGCSFAWKIHTRIVKLLCSSNDWKNRDSQFIRQGFKIGTLSDFRLSSLKDCLKTARILPVKRSDPIPWHAPIEISEQQRSMFAKWFRFYDLSQSGETVSQVLCDIIPLIRKCLGYGVRVVNVRCWGLLPNSPIFASNTWHSDFFPEGLYKVLIYISPPGSATGTTELKLDGGEVFSLNGPPGSWVFFDSTKITHRGIAPEAEERIVMEITTAPTFTENARPNFLGNNSAYPLYPWITPKYL